MIEDAPFDPFGILAALRAGGVEFVLIGGLAGVAHGSRRDTDDLDLCHSRERANLDRLAAVLRDLGARLRGAPADVPFLLDGETLRAGQNFTFATRLGSVDILAEPQGIGGFDELAAAAVTVTIGEGPVRVASLGHLIAMKEAAGRPKDLVMAIEYRSMAAEIEAGAGGPAA